MVGSRRSRRATIAKCESCGLDHQTTIPPLLVPRLVQGLKLPLIVHPQDPSRVEVQWHLV
ncbi:MAG: hypothetical protein IPI67_29295 [Myxococcales bacterium]|nr:hypothetical protein [Myxococcales bacterium]